MPNETQDVTLPGLMAVLLNYGDPTPVWMYSITIPGVNKYTREDKAKPRAEQRRCPYLTPDDQPELFNTKFEPSVMIRKHCKSLVRVNDDYEQAVRRRFIAEQRAEGRTAPMGEDEEFVADKPTWGAKLPAEYAPEGEKSPPPLFEWWMPKYTTTVKFYMAVRPIQCQQVWYEWVMGPKRGQRLTDEEVKYAKANYFDIKDAEMEADRQGIEKPIQWRKYLFDSIEQMTVGGTRYVIMHPKLMPEVPAEQRDRLMQLLEVRRPEQYQFEAKGKEKVEKVIKKRGPTWKPSIVDGIKQAFPDENYVEPKKQKPETAE